MSFALHFEKAKILLCTVKMMDLRTIVHSKTLPLAKIPFTKLNKMKIHSLWLTKSLLHSGTESVSVARPGVDITLWKINARYHLINDVVCVSALNA